MARILHRRPSAATIIALLALFVALGGPAQAKRFIDGKLLHKGSVTSRAIHNHTIRKKDLRHTTVHALKRVPPGAVSAVQIRNGAVSTGKLAPGAVGSPAILDHSVRAADLAANSVGSAAVADHSLTGTDIAQFSGRFTVAVPAIDANTCWSGAPADLAPERAHADIRGDAVIATPYSPDWPFRSLSVSTAIAASNNSRFALIVCNVTDAADPTPAFSAIFNYAVINLP